MAIVSAILFVGLVEILAATVVSGGPVPSQMVILWGVVIVLGALIALSVRAAFLWFLGFGLTLVLAVVLPERIAPLEMEEGSPAGIAFNVMGVTSFVFAGMAYFVRQRDRFQKESDDLLHNILPDQIATRLKSDRTMIAHDYESASVLFADVVDFTPMSAAMTLPELVGLLNTVFTIFDGLVAELGLEKIRTVGDAYMVAGGASVAARSRARHRRAGAPDARPHRTQRVRRPCHQPAYRHQLRAGRGGDRRDTQVRVRPVGDVVNTASRMESGGFPGSIQVTPATYELIRDDFACEPRGSVSVKGKGDMNTYILVSQR